MYQCSVCKSIPNTFSSYYSYNHPCYICGSNSVVRNPKNATYNVTSIDYLFPPIVYLERNQKAFNALAADEIGGSPKIPRSGIMDGFSFRRIIEYNEPRVGRLAGPLPIHNWRFQYKMRFLSEHRELLQYVEDIAPTRNVLCKINNEFYVEIEQDFLVHVILEDTLNAPRSMTVAIAKGHGWVLRENIKNILDTYKTNYNEFAINTQTSVGR
jgi:hypothetical protein